MKLLFITQKVDVKDAILGFTHDWLAKFAAKCESLTVVALETGEYRLPANVKVLSLGKESGRPRIKYIKNFYKYIWRERGNYDAVFVHMNKEYVILGWPAWRFLGKRIGFWYVHKQVSFSLKLAEKMADVIFTSSKESFNVPSRKLKIVGHGIDLAKFSFNLKPERSGDFKIIYVGRISQIKNQKLLIEAVNVLIKEKGVKNLKVDFIGAPVYPDDLNYKYELENIIAADNLKNYIKFSGSLPNASLPEIYAKADLSVNLCPTGGMDKAVLESMAVGAPVIALNKAFKPLLEANDLILSQPDAPELADKILALANLPADDIGSLGKKLSEKIYANYDLNKLADKIIGELEK